LTVPGNRVRAKARGVAYLAEFGGRAGIPVFQDCAIWNRHLIGGRCNLLLAEH
jgi:hypothetical protein